MEYKTIKSFAFYKCKETGTLYGMRVCDCRLIPDPEKAWERIRKRNNDNLFETDNFILLDFPDEIIIYMKQ